MLTYQSLRKTWLRLYLSVSLVIFMTSAMLPLTTIAQDVTGTWKADIETQIGKFNYTYLLKQEGTQITGKIFSEMEGEKRETVVVEGKLAGDSIMFVEMMKYQDNDIRISYNGKVKGDEISFTRQVGEYATEVFIAKREKTEVPPAATETKK